MQITPELLRQMVLECLRKPHDRSSNNEFSVQHIYQGVANLSQERNLIYQVSIPATSLDRESGRPKLHPNLWVTVWDVVWDLVIEGILRPGGEHEGAGQYPLVHLTAYGKEAIKGNNPHDPDGYLNEIRDSIPTVDDVIITYIAESAKTLRVNCLLSSTVALGCASEKAFLILLETYRNALDTAPQQAFDAVLAKARGIKQQHQAFMADYPKHQPRLKKDKGTDWLSGMDNALNFVLTYFREVRNNAGHPSGASFTRREVLSHLMVFPEYLRLIYDFIDWIEANKPLP